MEDLKLELYDLSAKGYKRVVLVGIDLSSYGKDIGCHLVDAVTMACTTEGIEQVRLGSLEAADAHRSKSFHPGRAAKLPCSSICRCKADAMPPSSG